jgi:hypothetical protein
MRSGGGVWPKTCACGASFREEEWAKLPFAGRVPDNEGDSLEMRTCKCGSTLAMRVSDIERTTE